MLGDCGDESDGVGDVAARAAALLRDADAEDPCLGEPRQDVCGAGGAQVETVRSLVQPARQLWLDDCLLCTGCRMVHARTLPAPAQRYGSNSALSGGWPRLFAKLQRVARLTPRTTSSAAASLNPALRKRAKPVSSTRPRCAITALVNTATALSCGSATGWRERSASTAASSRPAFL